MACAGLVLRPSQVQQPHQGREDLRSRGVATASPGSRHAAGVGASPTYSCVGIAYGTRQGHADQAQQQRRDHTGSGATRSGSQDFENLIGSRARKSTF